jgi:hypothetical protein
MRRPQAIVPHPFLFFPFFPFFPLIFFLFLPPVRSYTFLQDVTLGPCDLGEGLRSRLYPRVESMSSDTLRIGQRILFNPVYNP